MPIWSFADAVERLRDPFAIEDLAHPPAPVRPFVVDLRGLRPPVPEADRELLRSSLRALRTVTVDGVELAENAAVIGTALESLDTAAGLIWVLVNLQ